MFTEMDSPWAGDGRGVVTQRIFSKDGTLLATCFQEASFSGYAEYLRRSSYTNSHCVGRHSLKAGEEGRRGEGEVIEHFLL